MLPGFRILCAIVLLSVSVLVFGVGAAAFLRAAHENLASTPAYRPIELAYAPRIEMPAETLSMMRVQTPADIGTTDLRSEQPASLSVTPREEAVIAPPPGPSAGLPKAEAPVADSPKADDLTTATVPDILPPAEPARPTAVIETPAPVTSAPETIAAPPAADVAPAPAGKAPDAAGQDSLTPADRADAHVAGPLAALQSPAPAPPEPPAARQDKPVASQASAPADTAPKPEQRAAVAEPDIAAQPPLPIAAVKLPKPRVDPKVIEAEKADQRARQQRAARAQAEARLRARRVANARARAAAQTRPADPFAPTPFQQQPAAR